MFTDTMHQQYISFLLLKMSSISLDASCITTFFLMDICPKMRSFLHFQMIGIQIGKNPHTRSMRMVVWYESSTTKQDPSIRCEFDFDSFHYVKTYWWKPLIASLFKMLSIRLSLQPRQKFPFGTYGRRARLHHVCLEYDMEIAELSYFHMFIKFVWRRNLNAICFQILSFENRFATNNECFLLLLAFSAIIAI